jgi:hypothetical protein
MIFLNMYMSLARVELNCQEIVVIGKQFSSTRAKLYLTFQGFITQFPHFEVPVSHFIVFSSDFAVV